MGFLKKFMIKIDRAKVRKAFDRGARRYEETVVVQKLVVERILSKLAEMNFQGPPKRILDVGAGTGMLLRSLQKTFPGAFLAGLDLAQGMGVEAISSFQEQGNLLYVAGDAEYLPFADETFDLVVSTSTYQWLAGLTLAFSEAKRVLAPGGMFLFAMFGEGTLFELQNAYRQALISENATDKDRARYFFSPGDVAHTLELLEFTDVAVEYCREKEFYPDVTAFLRSLKGIGAATAACLPSRGLGGRRIIARMMETYQRDFLEEKGVPVSYGVIFGSGRKV